MATEDRITNWTAVHQKTFGEAVERVCDFYGLSPSEAEDEITRAIEAGDLIEDASGIFPVVRVPEPDNASDTPETDADDEEVSEQEALHCLNDILDWYHSQIDEPIEYEESEYDTPREYYRDARGWTDETINSKRLGYAPPDHKADLLNQLLIDGYEREVILSTGLFGERKNGSLYTIWDGRYVLPYADENGDLVFAISRAGTPPHPRDRAGRYDEDDEAVKYHKIPTTRDEVAIEEPIYGLDSIGSRTKRVEIYGLDTLDSIDSETVLITEGIADAITAHQHGFACISPVTVQFSHEDMGRLATVLEENGINRAILVQDAERPTSSIVKMSDGDENLYIDQFGPGLQGAVKTASKLVDDGIDARVGELPRPGLKKVDLDDYLIRWGGDLSAVLRSAKPPSQHPASELMKPSRKQAAKQEQNNNTPQVNSENKKSALWDLDITDVTGWNVGDRGNNPLGHRGDSEGYFKVFTGNHGNVAYDHKFKTAYNALTYLLCEAGVRYAGCPGGPLTDEEVWLAWRHAKESGYIRSDDKCPSAALKHLALKHDVCTVNVIEDGWKLPRKAYEATLDIIEEEYDIEHGHPVGGEPVSTVPLTRIQHLSWDDARQFVRKQGFDWPSTQQARSRLEDAVVNTIAHQDYQVVDAPTALGKSYTVATFPWLRYRGVTGGAPVVHVHATREARDEAFQESRESGVDAKVILGRKEACPVAAGEYDASITINDEPASEWMDRQCDGKGIPLSVAHSILAKDNDQDEDLPCSPGEAECPSKTQWKDVPWNNTDTDDEEKRVTYDVVHATHPMLFVPSMTNQTNIVIDELPDFSLRVEDGDRDGVISMSRIQNAVTAHLTVIDAPVTTWETFLTLARSRCQDEFGELYGSLAEQYFELRDAVEERSPTLDWYVEEPNAHVLSRAIIECIIDAFEDEPDQNGLRCGKTTHTLPRMDDEDARVRVSLVIDDDNRVRSIRQTPDLTGGRSVVGLDAYPAMPLWHLNSVEDIDRTEILNTDERRFWRLFERGLFAVQVGDATRPLSGPNAKTWFSEEKLNVLLSELVEEGLRTSITTSQVETEITSILSKNGVVEPETMHYGEVRSRNDFGHEDVGFVNGCMDPGDDFVLTVLAECGCDAEPETVTDEDGNERRAHGRGFVGPDADTADEILASVRENEVAQAAGRYARNADNPDDRAVVYVRTNATPTGFADVQVGGVEWIATVKQAEIIRSLKDDEWITAKEIADEIDSTKRHVLKTLKKLRDRDIVDCRQGAGAYGADLYRAISGTETHLTELGAPIVRDNKLDGSMWALVVSDTDPVRTTVDYDSPEPNSLTPNPPERFAPPSIEPCDGVEITSTGSWIVNGGNPA